MDVAGNAVPDVVINELLSNPAAARLIASCTIDFNDDIDSLLLVATVAFVAFVNCFALGVVVGPFNVACGSCLGDIRPGDVRLLTTELVGDKQFAIDELTVATTALDDVVVKLLVMEVKMVEWSLAEPADEALCWLLPMLFVAFWMLLLTPLVLFGVVVDADDDTSAGTVGTMLDDTGVCWLEIDWRAFITDGCCCWLTECVDAFELTVALLAAVDANADEYCPFSVCAGGCDVLCLATAANAIGLVGGIIDDDNVEMDEACWAWDAAAAEVAVPDFTDVVVDEMADTFNAADVVAGDIWFLLGVEHTIDLFCDEDIVVLLDEAVEFRSDLFARTAVGLTGYIKMDKKKIAIFIS